MKKQLSLAVLALLSLVQVQAIKTSTSSDLSESSSSLADAYLETDRFIGADGEPIILAETDGHARIVLSKVRKTIDPTPLDIANLQLEECNGKEKGAKTEEA